jgi:hypothetical protein
MMIVAITSFVLCCMKYEDFGQFTLRRVSQVVQWFITHVPAHPCFNVSVYKKCYATCLITLRAIVKTPVRHCGTYVTYQVKCTT